MVADSTVSSPTRRHYLGRGPVLSYGTAIPYALIWTLLRSNCGIFETDTPKAITQKVRSRLRQVAIDPEQDGPVLLPHLLDVENVSAYRYCPIQKQLKVKS